MCCIRLSIRGYGSELEQAPCAAIGILEAGLKSQLCRRSAAQLFFPLHRGLTPAANTNVAAARLVRSGGERSSRCKIPLSVATQSPRSLYVGSACLEEVTRLLDFFGLWVSNLVLGASSPVEWRLIWSGIGPLAMRSRRVRKQAIFKPDVRRRQAAIPGRIARQRRTAIHRVSRRPVRPILILSKRQGTFIQPKFVRESCQ
jgi:hypothetical protein